MLQYDEQRSLNRSQETTSLKSTFLVKLLKNKCQSNLLQNVLQNIFINFIQFYLRTNFE